MTPPTLPPSVAHRRFPTVVIRPGGDHLPQALTVITCPDGDTPPWLMVWTAPADEPHHQAGIDLEASTIGRPAQSWEVHTDLGVFRVLPARGCGCGDPLKRFDPFTPMLMSSPACLRGCR